MQSKNIIYQWHFAPLIILLIIGIICLHYAISGYKSRKDSVCFWLAIFLTMLAECSPLHFLGMHCYFSAHMVSHVMLLLVCGPMLVISLRPKQPSQHYKRIQILSAILYKHSWLAWMAGVIIMWFWHIPAVFDGSFSSMQNPWSVISLLRVGSMLLAGILFSWPLFGPFRNYHIHPVAGVMYLFTACISCSLLGLLITFAPLGTYQHYAATGSVLMKMAATNPFGISRADDQQAAGLIMWVPCCFVYLTGCIYLLYNWFSEGAAPKNGYGKLITSNKKHG